MQRFVRFAQVKLLWIKLTADPLHHVGVLFVFRVSNGVEEITVAPRPAAIFSRAGQFAVNAPGVLDARLGLDGLLDKDRVFPASHSMPLR